MAFNPQPVDTSSPTPFPMPNSVPDGTNTPLALEGGPSKTTGGNTIAPAAVYLYDGYDVTQGTSTDAANTNTTIGQLKQLVLLLDVGQENMANSQSVAIASDQSAIPVTGTFWQATQPISGTVTSNQGGSNWTENVVQLNGTTIDTNSGNKSAGTQRVVLATDQPALTNALLTNPQAIASGGSTASHTISAASTNATNLKNSAGTLYGFCISNSNAAARFFKLYNKASAPTVGTDTPVVTVQLPANSTVMRAFPVGLSFAAGISWALTTGIADADTGAVGTDISVDLDYK